MELLYKSYDAVLIEADGSRRMPLKWPAPHEPVIPERTDITVCVCGLSSLGRPLSEVMYRAEHLPEAMRRETAEEALIAAVVSSLDGGLKGARGEFRVFMNQTDKADRAASAEYIQKLLAVRGIQSAWGSLRDRALCGACPYQARA
jgi:molybdenum cofactor cytidylyltransferase